MSSSFEQAHLTRVSCERYSGRKRRIRAVLVGLSAWSMREAGRKQTGEKFRLPVASQVPGGCARAWLELPDEGRR